MAAKTGGTANNSDSGTQTYGSLTIDKRVLTTPSRTIAIKNVSSVSVGTHIAEKSAALLFIGALVCFLICIGSFSASQNRWGTPDATAQGVGFLFGLLALFLLINALTPPDRTHFLIISTNDGTKSLFTGPNRELLDEVRTLLTNKINTDDESATFNINFTEGKIENLHLGGVGKIEAGGIVAGNNNQVAGNSPGARIGTRDTAFTISNSPGAQAGFGNIAQGTSISVQTIDYSRYLPQISEWHQFYAQRADTQVIAQRFDELEKLLRAGTPTPESKGRVRSLLGELGSYLRDFTPAIEVFRDILRLVTG